jgi:Protein of unknown function (DUF3007)
MISALCGANQPAASAFVVAPSPGAVVRPWATVGVTQHQPRHAHFSNAPPYVAAVRRISLLLLSQAEPEGSTDKVAVASLAGSEPKADGLPFWLDPGTKGGAVVLTFVLFFGPVAVYAFLTNVLGYDEIETGKVIGIGFTVVATLAWVSTYIFRVATKDMTYVRTGSMPTICVYTVRRLSETVYCTM